MISIIFSSNGIVFRPNGNNAARKEARRMKTTEKKEKKRDEEKCEYFRCSRSQTNDVSASSKSQTIVNNVTMQYISLNRYARPFYNSILFCA